MTRLTLDPRTIVLPNPKEAARGRLGLLLYDEDVQRVVAVTVAQIAARSSEIFMEDGSIVASRSESRTASHHGDISRRADTMLWTLKLKRGLKLSETQLVDVGGSAIASPTLTANANRLLGEKVLVQNSTARPRVGRLYSTSARFRMPAPETGHATVFRDALELVSLDNSPLTVKGDAGSVVTSMSGEVLGVVVCGIGKTSYAAPLAGYVEEQSSLHIMSTSFIRRYNGEVDGRSMAINIPVRHAEGRSTPNFEKLKAAVKSSILGKVLKAASVISATLF